MYVFLDLSFPFCMMHLLRGLCQHNRSEICSPGHQGISYWSGEGVMGKSKLMDAALVDLSPSAW